MPPPMNSSTLLIAGLVLLGFLLGFLIASSAGSRRTRRATEEGEYRASTLQKELGARARDLETARSERDTRAGELAEAQTQVAELTSQLRITQAQLEELQSGSTEIEDRLSAAEARALSADAEVAQNRADIAQWSAAYAQLKSTHARLSAEHGEAQERRMRIEDELRSRRTELNEISARLEELQKAQTLQIDVRSADAGELQQTVAAVSLARAEAEAALRTREMELSDLRSQTASMRYSLNVLTASGAQLAEMLANQKVIDPNAEWLEARPAALPAPVAGEAAAEELADLEGMIRDWFGDVEYRIPYDRHTLLLFGGLGHENRYPEARPPHDLGVTIDAVAGVGEEVEGPGVAVESGEAEGAIEQRTQATVRPAPELPPALMLAAIKAATTTALERSAARQFEIARELADHRQQLEALGERVRAWRAMLSVTLGDDPETLHLLDDQLGADPVEMLSACATVALTAYQKKDAQARAREAQAAASPPSPPLALPAARRR